MHEGFSLPQSSWIALLSIAHQYEFLNVRERAIRGIYDPAAQLPQDPMLLISVAEKYDVPPKHLVPSLVTFLLRPQPLSEDEVLRLSALTVSRLAHAREDFVRRTANTTSSPMPVYAAPTQTSMFGGSAFGGSTFVISPPTSAFAVPASGGPSGRENVAKDVVHKIWQIQNDG